MREITSQRPSVYIGGQEEVRDVIIFKTFSSNNHCNVHEEECGL